MGISSTTWNKSSEAVSLAPNRWLAELLLLSPCFHPFPLIPCRLSSFLKVFGNKIDKTVRSFIWGCNEEKKGINLMLIIAGIDTTAIAMTWILSNLMNNRHALNRAQQELDLKIGLDRWAEDSDMEKLNYLQAIIKETFRLYPPVPMLIPLVLMEDCCVSGYHIPQGTRLFVNAWKLHRDPRVWSKPEEFEPERFLTSHRNVDVLGRNFELTPFGSGGRSCPGINWTLQAVHLTMARLLQGFDLTTPLDAPVDMTEDQGASAIMPKATPLELVLTPRLPPHLYHL
ncbi:xanthotoxin 5-hydroxylase CYP82C4-like [Gossypium hirsutum]|uniref:Xanthotoxin 5-hydroxylase CYP82C4-like n=1 Tax=Gossypium hirsutum TaxID=3635 RepID=A0A1U8L3B2_GOSHI|nr:xanthotoxin 5-hydroxylase CYP82C4-like [Gossypium hirsutum]